MKIADAFKPRKSLPQEISSAEFLTLLLDGKIVDGRAGGVVIGKGARLIFRVGTGYTLAGEAEGGAFIVNGHAAVLHINRLRAISAGLTLRERVEPSDLDQCDHLICTLAEPHDRPIWINRTSTVVPPEPAAKHLGELIEMNRHGNPYLRFDLFEAFKCDMGGSADGII